MLPEGRALAQWCQGWEILPPEEPDWTLAASASPALAAAATALGNRFFPGKRTAATLEQTINRIGFAEAIKLAGLAFLWQAAGAGRNNGREFLNCSIATAILMEYMAYDLNEDPGRACLAGLLGAIGEFLPPDGKNRPARARAAALSATLLKKWGFPEKIYFPVLNQVHPLLSRREETLSLMLNLARLAAPSAADPARYPFSRVRWPGAAARRGLDRTALAACLPSSTAWLRATMLTMERELGPPGKAKPPCRQAAKTRKDTC